MFMRKLNFKTQYFQVHNANIVSVAGQIPIVGRKLF